MAMFSRIVPVNSVSSCTRASTRARLYSAIFSRSPLSEKIRIDLPEAKFSFSFQGKQKRLPKRLLIAAQTSSGSSVLDRITDRPAAQEESAPDMPATSDDLLPPSQGDDAPLTPTAD